MGESKSGLEVSFSPLENGLDFVVSGLRRIAAVQEKSDLKYGVLHLSAGIDLVLKECLRRHDWRLIFLQPDKATQLAYESGNFRSVDHYQCLDLLEKELGLQFTQEEKDRLGRLRNSRNRLEHFTISDSQLVLESTASRAVTVLLRFLQDAFEEEELAEEHELLAEMRALLGSIESVVNERWQAIEGDLESWRSGYGQFVLCPICSQESLKADVNVKCAFCGYEAACEDAAELWVVSHLGEHWINDKDIENPPRQYCPNCDSLAMVDTQGALSNEFVCFGCGWLAAPGQLEHCPSCGQLADVESISSFGCTDCTREYMAADHR